MENSVALRPAQSSDLQFLLQVYGSARADELALTNWTDKQKDQFVRMQFAAQRKFYEENYSGAEYLVILFEDQPAGRLYLHRREDEIRVMDIALQPEFRRKGIATFLFDQLFAEARRARKPVGIHVEIFNPALRLYEKLGFKKIADNGVYHFFQWFPESPAVAA
ncbi:MAG: GNAT family N-acetyltransferase [Akkermansiaceae bacterium]|nr:GNAT family N-acetyltransferase [Verrucomicrobiales bacterium]